MSEIPYSFWQKSFHRLVLGNRMLSEFLLDLELSLGTGDVEQISNEKHIFIAGLARSGTTLFLRNLYGSGQFASLTYRDMPMVLAPSLWRKISNFSKKNIEPVERAHGDGLLIDYDSPEAFEEVFWMTCDGSYLLDEGLVPHNPSMEVLEKFAKYVGRILLSKQPKRCRYLSKNNNNILRLKALGQIFPYCILFIPFRDPLQHSFSLMKQHYRFIQNHKKDRFISDYMRFLGHYEFGPAHRPFKVTDTQLDGNPFQLNYWLSLWHEVYSWITKDLPEFCYPLSYERFCKDNQLMWDRLRKKCDLELPEFFGDTLDTRVHRISSHYSNDLYQSCLAIYDQLAVKESSWLD